MGNPARQEEEAAAAPPFEFCKVCKLNHNQGLKHKYFPNHAKSLSSFLSRAHHKLSDVRFFLKNPSPLRPEHAQHNRLWCVFCDCDVSEIGSSFACFNAIYHFASTEHLKNLKNFLWKNGGGMNRVDSFRVSETDLLKWEKRCETLSATQSSGKGLGGSLQATMKDIQYQVNSNHSDSFENSALQCFKPSISHGVMPLQSLTNERHLQSYPEAVRVTDNRNTSQAGVPFSAGSAYRDIGLQGPFIGSTSEHLTANGVDNSSGVTMPLVNDLTVGQSSSSILDQRTQPGKEWTNDCHSLGHQENLYSEEVNTRESETKSRCITSTSSTQTGKPHKLNPKRVGAAWAEKRRAELEMEKRGEMVASYDPNWLPNFGGVWQAGTRKESRKEFETEKKRIFKAENQPEIPVKLEPYISKRMVRFTLPSIAFLQCLKYTPQGDAYWLMPYSSLAVS